MLWKKLSEIEGVTIFGPLDASKKGGVVTFNIDGVHPLMMFQQHLIWKGLLSVQVITVHNH